MTGDSTELHRLYVQWLIQYKVRQFPEQRRPPAGSQYEQNIAEKYARERWYYNEFASWYANRYGSLQSVESVLPASVEGIDDQVQVDYYERRVWGAARQEARDLVGKLTYGELVHLLTGRLRSNESEVSAVAEKIAMLLGVVIVDGEVILPEGIKPSDYVAFQPVKPAVGKYNPNLLVDKIVRSTLDQYVDKVCYVEVLARLRSWVGCSIPVVREAGRAVALAIGLEVHGNTVQLPAKIDPLAVVSLTKIDKIDKIDIDKTEIELDLY